MASLSSVVWRVAAEKVMFKNARRRVYMNAQPSTPFDLIAHGQALMLNWTCLPVSATPNPDAILRPPYGISSFMYIL